MSKTSAIIALIMGLAIALMSLWVRGLKADVADREATIKTQGVELVQKDKANKDLSDANFKLSGQIVLERQATAERAAKVKELENQLNSKKDKYDKATVNDACANTRAPDDVLSVMQ